LINLIIYFVFPTSYSCLASVFLVLCLIPEKGFWQTERILFLLCFLLGMLCMFL